MNDNFNVHLYEDEPGVLEMKQYSTYLTEKLQVVMEYR